MALLGADDQGLPGCGDEVGADVVEAVDVHQSADLGHEPFDEAEVASGDADDGADQFTVGVEVGVVQAELLPVVREYCGDVFGWNGRIIWLTLIALFGATRGR